jgi:N utilization substance protein A
LPDIKLDLQAIQQMALFERMTKVSATDMVETAKVAYFTVPKGSANRLSNNPGVDRLGRKMGKSVRWVELRKDPEAFLRQLFWAYGVQEISVEERSDGLHGRVRVSPLAKGKAIGKGGENLNALRELAKRHVGIVGIILE